MNMNTPDTIEVTPLDADKVSLMLTELVGQSAELGGRWAIIGRQDGAWGLVYDECVLLLPTEDTDEVRMDVYKKKQGYISMVPSWTVGLSRKDLRKNTLPPTTLRDFMGERYNDNGRIQINTAVVCQWMKESK